MPKHAPRLALVSFILAGVGATPLTAQEDYRHGHLRHVEPGVTLQRATEVSAEEAVTNLPFLPGDRVWTDAAGRVEFQFPEGSVVRLDTRSKLDYSDHDESRDERVVLRLWSGSLILRARGPESAIFEIETPGGLVQAAGPGVVRIDVEGGEARVSVYEGEASLDTGRDGVRLAAGQSTWARWGDAPSAPVPFDRYAQDDFAAWDGDLESRRTWAAHSQRYLPEELEPYAPEFDSNGTWVYEQPVGYVWQPRVAVGWTPYTNGRWTWTLYGWTWVPYEPWGWAPHHYGRWGLSVSLGWYWIPGRVWGPGWVHWGYGGGYVGWCALGWRDRPVVPWPHHRGWADPGRRGGHGAFQGYAVPRGSAAHDRAWTVVQREDLRRGGYARRRVDPAGVGSLHVAESFDQRPDRGVRGLSRAVAVPRAAAARPRPGAASRAQRGASPVPTGSLGLRGSSSRTPGVTPSVPRRSGDTIGTTAGSRGSSAARARPRPEAGRTSTGVSSRPQSGRASGGVSSSPRSTGSSIRRPTAPSRSGSSSSGAATRRPSSSSWRSSGVSSRPQSGRAGGGVSSSPRSTGSSIRRPAAPPSSGSSNSGAASRRPSSGSPRSSGASSRAPSRPSRSGVSSRSPRSSGASPSGGASGQSRRSSGSSSSRSGSARSRSTNRH